MHQINELVLGGVFAVTHPLGQKSSQKSKHLKMPSVTGETSIKILAS